MTDTVSNISGSVNFNSDNANIGGDAVGHDKITDVRGDLVSGDKTTVDTGGGASTNGDVEVSGGKVVGRDDHSTNITYEAPAPIVPALHQLPAPPADFVGREAELTAILADLQRGAVITGIRGLGGKG